MQRNRNFEKAMWTLNEAQNLIRELQPVAARLGYVLALFGSVIETGTGNDCDLVAFQLPDVLSDGRGLASLLSLRVSPNAHCGQGFLIAPIVRQSTRTNVPQAESFQFHTEAGKRVDLLVLSNGNSGGW